MNSTLKQFAEVNYETKVLILNNQLYIDLNMFVQSVIKRRERILSGQLPLPQAMQ